MNLIMIKIRNSLKSVNVDKLTYIYMNNRTLNRPQNIKKKLTFVDIELNENYLCEMEDNLLQKKQQFFQMKHFHRKEWLVKK